MQLKAFYDNEQCKEIFSQKVKTNVDETKYSALNNKLKDKLKQDKDEDMWKVYNHFLSLVSNIN